MLLDWSAYEGFEVAFYEIYRVGSYDLSSAEFIDMVPGQTLQYVDRSARCSNIYTYRIKALGFGSQQFSWSDTTRARNRRTADIDPNEVVRATVVNNQSVQVEWLPVTMQDLTTIVLERRSIEYPEWTAVALLGPGTDVYLDHDVAINRESYSYRITARDSCGFFSEISNMGKSILLKPGPIGAKHVFTWTDYVEWGQGVDFYELEVYNDFTQSWELVDVVSGDTTSYDVSEVYFDQPEYCFRVRAHESGGHQATSLSNQVCIPVEPEIFAPNAFTPNGDGYNDEFYLKGVFIGEFQLMIFDRWGKKIFESQDIDQGWDGNYKGIAAVEGVYTFVARGIGYNNRRHEITGTVTLIR
jgi:gliding motility-associated-like protein